MYVTYLQKLRKKYVCIIHHMYYMCYVVYITYIK